MPDDDSRYQLSLVGSDITLKKEVDQRTALAILQAALGSGVHATSGPAISGQAASSVKAPVSLREYIEDVQAKTNPAKIVSIGHYLREVEGQADFSRDDVKARFRSAGEPLPGNFARDFQQAIQAGWITEDHQRRGQYYITRRGEDVIGRKFTGATVAASSRPRRRRDGPPEG